MTAVWIALGLFWLYTAYLFVYHGREIEKLKDRIKRLEDEDA